MFPRDPAFCCLLLLAPLLRARTRLSHITSHPSHITLSRASGEKHEPDGRRGKMEKKKKNKKHTSSPPTLGEISHRSPRVLVLVLAVDITDRLLRYVHSIGVDASLRVLSPSHTRRCVRGCMDVLLEQRTTVKSGKRVSMAGSLSHN